MAMSPRLLRPRASGLVLPTDADARAYVLAVNSADQQPLEPLVVQAIDAFVIGCKADGIWDAIKASCVLAGARTLAGALVPLKGAAPTNNGPFVSGDYNRETGLVGNGTTKFLNSNRNNNADPQNSKHVCVYASVAPTSVASQFPAYIGAGGSSAGACVFGRLDNNSTVLFSRHISSSASNRGGAGAATGFIGQSRASGTNYVFRHGGNDATVSLASQTPFNGNLLVYHDISFSGFMSPARVAFYSIGESLSLASLDTRVSNLITAIGAAI